MLVILYKMICPSVPVILGYGLLHWSWQITQIEETQVFFWVENRVHFGKYTLQCFFFFTFKPSEQIFIYRVWSITTLRWIRRCIPISSSGSRPNCKQKLAVPYRLIDSGSCGTPTDLNAVNPLRRLCQAGRCMVLAGIPGLFGFVQTSSSFLWDTAGQEIQDFGSFLGQRSNVFHEFWWFLDV